MTCSRQAADDFRFSLTQIDPLLCAKTFTFLFPVILIFDLYTSNFVS